MDNFSATYRDILGEKSRPCRSPGRFSLGFRSFRADFSYQPYGDLGNSLQFGLGYRF